MIILSLMMTLANASFADKMFTQLSAMLRSPLDVVLSEQFSNSRFIGVSERQLRSKSVVDYLLDFYELVFDSDAYDQRRMKTQRGLEV